MPPGVPEPVLGHLGAMQDDIRRVSAFLGLTPTCVELAAAGQAPVQQPAVPGAPPRQEQQPWGSAPPPREPPPVQNLGEYWAWPRAYHVHLDLLHLRRSLPRCMLPHETGTCASAKKAGRSAPRRS